VFQLIILLVIATAIDQIFNQSDQLFVIVLLSIKTGVQLYISIHSAQLLSTVLFEIEAKDEVV
jgi:hypothetical protein